MISSTSDYPNKMNCLNRYVVWCVLPIELECLFHV
jgi:hypothetical protein